MKRGGTVLLLLNGELRDRRTVASLARRADVVVCADGGARHALALRLVPDVVVGDMDSAPLSLQRKWRRASFIRNVREDRSDLDKALDYITDAGARRVWIAGALGGGLDHEMVNFAVLEARPACPELFIVGGGVARLFGSGSHPLGLKKGGRFSLLAAPRASVTLTGSRYALRRQTLTRGSRGLGNLCSGPAVLTVHRGRIWFICGNIPRFDR